MVAAAGKEKIRRAASQGHSCSREKKVERRPRGIKTAVGAVEVEDTGSAISD